MSFHLYTINELYSNADGTIQFIELKVGNANGESLWQGQTIKVVQGLTVHSFTFPTNLPSPATANTSVLIATQGFAALGIVTPDFIVPSGFLFTSDGATVNFANVDSVAYSTLPLDGSLSINRLGTTAVNSPTNFAGVTASVVINSPPALSAPLTDQIVGVGQSFAMTVPANAFVDPNGDALSYSATLADSSALPSWLGFDAATRAFGGTPQSGNVGAIELRVTASDGHGGTGSDTFVLTIISGHVVSGSDGADALSGTAQNDSITGGPGNDTLDGGAGADSMAGGSGNDSFVVDDAGDVVTEIADDGIDTVQSSVSYVLPVNVEILTLAGNGAINATGNSADNALTGNGGSNSLSGLDGNDVLKGGGGADSLDGGTGSDIAQYQSDHGAYVVLHGPDGAGVVAQSGGEGVDWLYGIESLQFADATLALGSTGRSALEYTASYADLIAAFGTNSAATLDHFAQYGFGEGRQVTFDGLAYIASHTDLANAFGANADAGANHYISYGKSEGRTTSFDGLEYIASYSDLINAFGANADAGASHYINYGRNEGRAASFNGLEYIASYTDLINAFGANADAGASHYISYGRNEGRTTSFDGLEYIASYSDLVNAFGANADAGASHYISYGRNEGRTTTFDGLEYIASYGDLIQAFGVNASAGASHYINYGLNEGRTEHFNPAQYLANYADLQAAFGSDTHLATIHFIQYGYAEGRTDQAPT